MRTATRLLLSVLPLVLLLAATTSAGAEPPWSLEQLYSKPWPFGSGFRHVALSDDGALVACAWDQQAESIYDLWVYDVAADQWTQRTDLWPAREAHRRREFSRDLAQAREDWEVEHADAEEEGSEADGDDEGGEEANTAADAGEDASDAEQFDEAERIEEFEKDLAKERDRFGGIGEIKFARGGHEVLYVFEGALWSLNLDDAEADPRERLRLEQGLGRLQRIEGRDELLLVSDADVLLWEPISGQLRQLTTGGHGDYDNASLFAMTTDLRWLATVRRDYRSVRKQQMPDLLAEDPTTTSHYHVRPQDTPENVKLLLIDYAAADPWTIEVDLEGEEPYFHVENLKWSPLGDGRLLVCTISGDTRTYSAYVVTPPADGEDEASVELLYRELDERWINWRRTRVDWAYGGSLLLQSEKDGLAGVYRLAPRPEPVDAEAPEPTADSPAGSESDEEDAPDLGSHEPVPLYVGEHEIIGMRPLKHSPHVLLALCYPDPSFRGIALLDLDTGQKRIRLDGRRRNSWLAISEDETWLAYSIADENRMAELTLYPLAEYIATAFDPAPPYLAGRMIRDREPETWKTWATGWNQRFITVPGEGGDIAVKLWLPPDWSADGQYPLLIWAHGAGYAQTVTREPGFYELFHPWVAEARGWLVAEVDYRGSEGYGRDWRVSVWGRLGHPETDDLVAVKHFLVEQYCADPQRTALWGWSYGGFLTLMAQGLAPGEFPVGIAVAPVTRWDNYYHYYSTCRLGHPDDNPDEYELSSAEEYLAGISDDLLIVHGLRDDNTLFQSVAQYIEKGHELGIHVELKLFPGDDHGIGNEHHYIRIYEAILEYTDEHWPPADG